ncbi:MAG: flagellar biosynthetic protein FliO [Deltaproteobacteria bacterium]|nr:flagellar biosynthetic protein FliO [Deltaproteobacteria bacterium]
MHTRRTPRRRSSFLVWIVLGGGFLCGAAFAVPPSTDGAPASAASALTPTPAATPPEAPDAPGVAPGDLIGPVASAWTPAGAASPEAALTGAPPVDLTRSLRNLLVFAGLLVMAGAGWVFLRDRRGRGGLLRESPLELIASVRLGGRWPVSLVRVPGRLLVVGATDNGIALLTELDDELEDEVVPDVDDELVPPRRSARRDTAEFAPPRAGAGERPTAWEEEELTYRRPGRRSAATTVAQPARRHAESPADDGFLEELLGRLDESRGAVMRAAAPADERAALRQRLQTLRRGPTAL